LSPSPSVTTRPTSSQPTVASSSPTSLPTYQSFYEASFSVSQLLGNILLIGK
jgi:hypothetical protein